MQQVLTGTNAMSWGMFSIGWLMVNESAKAQTAFERQYQNIKGPFNVSESPYMFFTCTYMYTENNS